MLLGLDLFLIYLLVRSIFVYSYFINILFYPVRESHRLLNGGHPYEADGGLMPPPEHTIRDCSSLTGFTNT